MQIPFAAFSFAGCGVLFFPQAEKTKCGTNVVVITTKKLRS
jgi:hypothetical protein